MMQLTKDGEIMGYQIYMNDKNVTLKRIKEYEFPILTQSKVISFGRTNISSIELNEGADWKTASLIGFGAGVGFGLAGNPKICSLFNV